MDERERTRLYREIMNINPENDEAMMIIKELLLEAPTLNVGMELGNLYDSTDPKADTMRRIIALAYKVGHRNARHQAADLIQ